MKSRQEVSMLVQRVLREGTFSMRELAKESRLSYGTLRAWAAGVRTPEGESLGKLSEGLRARAARLVELADQLDKAA